MTLANEQLSDLMWASRVLLGRGDADDSSAHAYWVLSHLSVYGVTDSIRRKAVSMNIDHIKKAQRESA